MAEVSPAQEVPVVPEQGWMHREKAAYVVQLEMVEALIAEADEASLKALSLCRDVPALRAKYCLVYNNWNSSNLDERVVEAVTAVRRAKGIPC